jgi:hypothetical protein
MSICVSPPPFLQAITQFMVDCYPGLLLRQELQYLTKVLAAPAR